LVTAGSCWLRRRVVDGRRIDRPGCPRGGHSRDQGRTRRRGGPLRDRGGSIRPGHRGAHRGGEEPLRS
jgi:hypothetical protein